MGQAKTAWIRGGGLREDRGFALLNTGGSGGDGWVTRYGPGGGYVNGHNGYKYTSRPLEMFSPYFGNSELLLCNCATDNVC